MKQIDGSANFLSSLQLFSHLIAHMKDCDGVYRYATHSLAAMCGQDSAKAVIGCSDRDFFPKYLCDKWELFDQNVYAGNSVLDYESIVPIERGKLTWCQSNKIPVRGVGGEVIGLCVTMNDFRTVEKRYHPNPRLVSVAHHMEKNCSEKMTLDELAAMCDLSVRQFCRVFKEVYKTNPHEYLTVMRINAACKDLESSSLSITDIAHRNGFYDSSHFGRQFQRLIGTTPSDYRDCHGQ